MKNDEDRKQYCNKLKIACEQALCLGKVETIMRKGKGESL